MTYKKDKLKYFLAAVVLLLSPLSSLALEPVNSSFNPGLLILDDAFGDTGTFGSAAGVQQFLESRGSVLADTSTDFLVRLREPTDENWKSGLDDPRPDLPRLRTAAELIYDAAQSNDINAQVLLVTLQKEQSLINGNFDSSDDLQRRLDRALGYGCPDNSPCQASFLGFYNQLFGTFDSNNDRWIGAAKSLARSFNYEVNGARVGRGPLIDSSNNAFGGGPYVRASRKGDTIVLQNTLGGFEGVSETQTVSLENFATAALYRYTPHVFNGNYNFWKFYQEWFKYPNGTIIKLSSGSTLWVIDNGLRRTFSSFVAQQRGLDVSQPIVVSQREFDVYVEGSRLVPKDGTLIKTGTADAIYIIEKGERRRVTQFTAHQRGLDLGKTVVLSRTEVNSYELGGPLLPFEGTLIRAQGDPTVYAMVGEEKRSVTFGVFQARNYSFFDVAVLPKPEVDEITTGSLMPPPDGTLVRGPDSPAVYLVENGTKRILSYLVFVQKGHSFGSVTILSEQGISDLTNGLPVPPADNTLIKKADHPLVFIVLQGTKVPVTATVFNQKGLYRNQMLVLSDHEVDALPTDDNVLPPTDGTLLRAENDMTVYLAQNGRLHPITYQAFINRGFGFSQVLILDPEEVSLYEKGEIIAQ